jgi:beta-lactamase class A
MILVCNDEVPMLPSRRDLLVTASAALALHSVAAEGASAGGISGQVKALFESLPGTHTLKFWAPSTSTTSEVLVETRSNLRIFIASAFKAYVLAARLKALDSPDVVERLRANKLALNESIWSLGSEIFSPPDLSGLVSERTAAEAMIMHSDNTATDMMLLATGPANVRQFIASLGLVHTQIPDSTRILAAYLLGLPNYLTATYAEVLQAFENGSPLVNPFLNNVETMASSASDLVKLYSTTLPDGFFDNPETTNEYRRVLALADGVFEAVPLGVSGFAKTGYADFPGFHVRSNAGAMTFDGKWVYFAGVFNWDTAELHDDETVAEWKAALKSALELIYQHLSAG